MKEKRLLTPGAALAAQRKKTLKRCPMCRSEFEGIKTAVYCSNKCRQKAKYERKKLTR